MAKKTNGYVVMDPNICHGKPTFRGTRILVKPVLQQVARGMDWETIKAEWRGAINDAAISEAIRCATEALVAQSRRPRRET